MNCQELDRLLYPYLDGEFQPEERLDVETHLGTCAACARRAEEERRFRKAVRHSVQASRAPASLRDGIQLGLRRQQRRASQLQWLRMSAAALVVVAVGGGWIAIRPEERHRFAADGAKRHQKPLPFEISNAAPEHVEAWFDGKLEHRVAVPRLSHAEVKGARITNVTDKQAAYISYETTPDQDIQPGRRVGVFVFDDSGREVEAQALPELRMNTLGSMNVAFWRDGELVYELVSDLDEADIRKLVLQKGGTARMINAPRPHEPAMLQIRQVAGVPAP